MSEGNLSGESVELGEAGVSDSGLDASPARQNRGKRAPGTGAPRTSVEATQEIRIRDLYALFARSKWLIIGLTALTTSVAIVLAFLAPKEYQATVVLAPVTPDQSGHMGSLGSVLSQFSGLASMVGLSGGANSQEAEDIATLKSQVLTRRFIEDNNLLPVLFAKSWDARTGRWKTDDPQRIPTLWKANEFFKDRVRTITQDKVTGLIRLSITWTDPVLAAQWANGLVAMTNAYLRNKAIDEANRNISYLEDKVQKTSIVGVQQGIYTLLQEEIGDAMVAEGKREYALKVIDPAYEPEKPYSPKKKLWALAGLIAGLLLSSGIVVFRASWAASS